MFLQRINTMQHCHFIWKSCFFLATSRVKSAKCHLLLWTNRLQFLQFSKQPSLMSWQLSCFWNDIFTCSACVSLKDSAVSKADGVKWKAPLLLWWWPIIWPIMFPMALTLSVPFNSLIWSLSIVSMQHRMTRQFSHLFCVCAQNIAALWCCSSDHTSASDVIPFTSPHSFTFLSPSNRLAIHHYKNCSQHLAWNKLPMRLNPLKMPRNLTRKQS